MNLFAWQESFSVKVPSLDAQHQRLLSILNAMNDAVVKGKEETVVRAILDDLVNYAAEHFHHEEKLMRLADYSGREEHKAEHKRLLSQLQLLREDVSRGATKLSPAIMGLLGDWLRHHLESSDRSYIETLLEKKIS